MVVGDRAIDPEKVTRTFPEGPGSLEAIAIYQVDGPLIRRVWFILGPKTLAPAKGP